MATQNSNNDTDKESDNDSDYDIVVFKMAVDQRRYHLYKPHARKPRLTVYRAHSRAVHAILHYQPAFVFECNGR